MYLLTMPQNVILSKNLEKLQGKRDNPCILNIHLSVTDRTNKASEWLINTSKAIEDSSKIITLDPVNIYRHSGAKKYIFFISIHRTSVNSDHML